MSKQHIYDNLKVGDLVYLDPKMVRSDWGKLWANNKMVVQIKSINGRVGGGQRIHDELTLSGICLTDKSAGEKRFDANRVLDFADALSQVKQESQRL